MDPATIDAINEAREIHGRPWRVMSGYRCEKHNLAEGGAKDSSHLRGLAIDVDCPSLPFRYAFLKAVYQTRKFAGIGVYLTHDSVHIDTDWEKHPGGYFWVKVR